jgi:hypothetical protein
MLDNTKHFLLFNLDLKLETWNLESEQNNVEFLQREKWRKLAFKYRSKIWSIFPSGNICRIIFVVDIVWERNNFDFWNKS